MRHVRMHVHVMMVVNRRHADDELGDMVIVVAVVDRAAKNSPAETGVNLQLVDDVLRQFNHLVGDCIEWQYQPC